MKRLLPHGMLLCLVPACAPDAPRDTPVRDAARVTITPPPSVPVPPPPPPPVLPTWYRDSDRDGYGASSVTVRALIPPAGYIARGGDCNDGAATINPGAREVCNGLDDNCDGARDPNDSDGDGFGDTCDRCDGRLYGGQILYDPAATSDADAQLRATLTDEYAPLLGRVTGTTFTVRAYSAAIGACAAEGNAAVVVARSDSPLLASAPAPVRARLAELASAPYEGYLQVPVSGGALWFVARRTSALTHAVYGHLDRLGVRFLGPGDHWTVVPSRRDIRIATAELVRPAWEYFLMNGSGIRNQAALGTLFNTELRRWEGAWDRWQRRLRVPREFHPAAHNYDAYITAHRDEIAAERSLDLAEVDGVRPRVETLTPGQLETQKLHYTHHGLRPDGTEDPSDYTSYDGLIARFSEWAARQIRDARERDPSGYGAFSTSVEPSDGGGHCNCAKCRALLRRGPYGLTTTADSSVSDRVFHLSNQAARRVAMEFPDARVAQYAYSQHAPVPSIPLEPNLQVTVVDGYHRWYTRMPTDDLVEAWFAKRERNPRGRFPLGLYEYACIADSCRDLPSFNATQSFARLARYHGRGMRHYLAEASESVGATGLARFLASRLAWNASADLTAAREEYFRLGFGPAQAPVKRMFDRWQSGWLFTWQEVALSLADMVEADRLVRASGTPEQVARVEDLERYVHYLRLRYEADQSPPGAARDAALDALLRHGWRIFESQMVQIWEQHADISAGLTEPAMRARWDVTNPSAAGWARPAVFAPFAPGELRALMLAGASAYTPITYSPAPTGTRLVDDDPALPASTTVESPFNSHSHSFTFLAPGGALRFDVYHRGHSATPAGPRVIVRDHTGRAVFSQDVAVTADGDSRTAVTVPSLSAGTYTLQLLSFASYSHYEWIGMPREVPFATDALGTLLGRRAYFYVPAGMRTLALYTAENTRPMEIYPPGATTPMTSSVRRYGTITVFDIPAGQDGRVWSLSNVDSNIPFRFLNLPTHFSFDAAHALTLR